LIFYTNGMIIVALLLFILWCRIIDNRKWQKLPFPELCDNCLFLFHAKLGYCKKKCKQHPTHNKTATTSFYQEKTATVDEGCAPQKPFRISRRGRKY